MSIVHARRFFVLAVLTLAFCSVANAAERPPHALLLTNGDRLPCTIGSGKGLHAPLTATWLSAPATVDLAMLKGVRFKSTAHEGGHDLVALTNGDIVAGRLVAITAQHVVLKSVAFGELQIPRQFAVSVTRHTAHARPLNVDFRDPDISGPTVHTRKEWWEVRRSWLANKVGVRAGISCSAPVAQNGPVTIEIEWVSLLAYRMLYGPITLMADVADRTKRTTGLSVSANRGYLLVSMKSGEQSKRLGVSRSKALTTGKRKGVLAAKLRMAYDPATGELLIWFNGEELFRHTVIDGPKTGKFVGFTSGTGDETRAVRVWRGIVPPDGRPVVEAEGEEDIVVTRTGQKLAVTNLMFNNGAAALNATTPQGNVRIPLKDVQQIALHNLPRRDAASPKGAVVAYTEQGRLTLVPSALTAKTLTGSSARLGKLAIDRRCLRGWDVIAEADPKGGPFNDALVDRTGRTIPCRVLETDATGGVQMAANWIVGQASVRSAALQRIRLHCAAPKESAAMVSLTNGDVVEGKLTEITDEDVTLEAVGIGETDIPRSIVTTIGNPGGRKLPLDTNFSSGKLGPWKVLEGACHVVDGRLTPLHGRTGDYAICTELEQSGPMTFEIKMRQHPLMRGQDVEFQIVPFARGMEIVPIATRSDSSAPAISFSTYTATMHMFWIQGNRMVRYYGMKGKFGLDIRLAYIPQKDIMRAWVNGKQLEDFKTPGAERIGTHLIIRALLGEEIEYVRVHPGIVPPSSTPAAKDADLIILANGDRFPTTDTVMADGTITAMLEGNEMRFAPDKLGILILRTNGRKAIKPVPRAVQVLTPRGSLTMTVERLTKEHLIGKSSYLGDVRISRSALTGIILHSERKK